MPVQDNEDKRTADQPVVDAEEELRRKQAKEQDEPSVTKSGKLLPILNAKAEHHQSRIDFIDEKIANQTDKIDRNKAIIEALNAKADKLEDTNRMLKTMLGRLPFVSSIIESNEKRIQVIREEKIPKREQRIEQGWKKIDSLTDKRDRISHKLDRVVALNDTIRSFSIGFNKERREAFSDAISRLNRASVECLNDKKNSCIAQKDVLMQTYNDPATNMVDKYKIQQKINDISERISAFEDKIMKLSRPETHYAEQTNDALDAQMKLTSEKIAEMTDKETVSMPVLAEETLIAASKTDELDKSKIAELADNFNSMSKVEELVEDDYNSIDGIINNGSKEDIDKAKNELSEAIKSMESLSENPFVTQEMRDNASQELEKMKSQLELLNMHDEVVIDNWLSDMLDNGQAQLTDNGGFKVNADYYFELPRNDRHFETMTETQAASVITALSASAVDFSAMSKGDDKVSIVVANKDVPALNDIMYSAIGKIAQTQAAKENAGKGMKGRYETVNPEYYASLSDKQRFTRIETVETARKIAAGLKKSNIPYSAVVYKNDTIGITVSKDNSQAFKQISNQVKAERFTDKQIPKQEKSKEVKQAFFSRSKMQRDAQRISGQKRQYEDKQQTPKKRNNQGLE